jgi:8-oxo-dGTP pyrophosphatase MutT (NUDIX family)
MRTAAEIAVFVTRRDGSEVLLLHRVPEHGGYWHVVAGGVESGETPTQAAERELLEETALQARVGAGVGVTEYADALTGEPVEPSERHDLSGVAIHIDCFRVEAPPSWEPVLNAEHDEHRWCSPAIAFRVLRWPATANALRQCC